METEYLGNAYTTQSSNDGCVAVACPIDAGCAINAIVDLADVTINLDKGHIFEAEVL